MHVTSRSPDKARDDTATTVHVIAREAHAIVGPALTAEVRSAAQAEVESTKSNKTSKQVQNYTPRR